MKFYSTNNKDLRVSFEEAVRQGLAPDGGLFMPEEITKLPDSFWKNFSEKTFCEISLEIAAHFLNEPVNGRLEKILSHALTFDVPLVQVEENIFSAELFHGPTLAFKDFGARFLAGVIGGFATKQSREMVVLVATSGDTGSAVANGFLNVPGTRVVVLYPSGKVSEIQEKQFTTLGGNITALEIEGTFDDCQRLVKQSFNDETMRQELTLTSANSINIARLLPQMFYYFRIFQQLSDSQSKSVVMAVPCGNFGNLTAGLMAKKMGLPVGHFIAATNENDVVPAYLQSGIFRPRPSQSTISNAMDVGDPSNFVRMIDLFNNNFESLSHEVTGYRISEEETRAAMKEVFGRNYVLDPHGAIAYSALKKYLSNHQTTTGIFLATAHPGKFRETVEATLSRSILLPERLLSFVARQKKSIRMKNDFGELKEFLLRDQTFHPPDPSKGTKAK